MASSVEEALRLRAAEYGVVNPEYPGGLIDYISSLPYMNSLAWDLHNDDTRNSGKLATRFAKVVAMDVSGKPYEHARSGKLPQLDNVSHAETHLSLTTEELHTTVGAEGTVDLITVAYTIQWVNLGVFYPQVRHMLRKPGGVFAVWSYRSKPYVDAAVDEVYDEFELKTDPYRGEELDVVEDGLSTLHFPFDPVPGTAGTQPMGFESLNRMNCLDYIIYLRSFFGPDVGVSRPRGVDRVDLLDGAMERRFLDAWGGPADMEKTVRFRVDLVVGAVDAARTERTREAGLRNVRMYVQRHGRGLSIKAPPS